MPLICCPNCGKEISDKALTCVHCNYSLLPTQQVFCPDCGETIDENESVCPKCGCPIEKKPNPQDGNYQQVEVIKININTKRILTIAIIVFLIIGITIGSLFAVKNHRKKENEKLLTKQTTEYKENYEVAVHKMLLGSAQAESCGNLIKKVWYNSIYEKSDPETDKYTRIGSTDIYCDFNTSLSSLYLDEDFKSDIDSLKSNKDEVSEIMKKLKDPPKGLESSYDVLKDYHDAYLSFVNIVIEPTGSLTSFSESFNSADTNAINCYEKAMNEIE